MPDFPIVDAHVHLYDPADIRFDWMASVPKLNSKHLSAEFNAATMGVDVDTIIFVEVDAANGGNMQEAAWVSKLAKTEKRLKAMVACLPMEQGVSLEKDMQALARLPETRGVRRLIQGHVDEPGWCLSDNFVSAMQLLPKYGLSFDLCIFHPQMKDTIELVRRCPDVSFVLDHIGKPGIKAGLTQPWQDEIRQLASLPNVTCKISGVVTEADHASWTEAQVLPYLRHAISAFGFDRVMFGGDWPVSELATSYGRWVKLVDQAVEGESTTNKRKLFRENALKFYRIS